MGGVRGLSGPPQRLPRPPNSAPTGPWAWRKRTFTFHINKTTTLGHMGGRKSAFSADMRLSVYTI